MKISSLDILRMLKELEIEQIEQVIGEYKSKHQHDGNSYPISLCYQVIGEKTVERKEQELGELIQKIRALEEK